MAEIIINGRHTTRQEMAEMLKDALAEGKPNAVILAFWSAFPWATCEKQCRKFKKCVHGDCHSWVAKMRFLQAMAGIKIRETDADYRKLVRSTFKTYREIGRAGEKPCFACGDPAKHRHHVLQIKHGGHNGPRNIVLLCERCHRNVHKYS